MNNELEGRYKEMWENARSRFINGACSIDDSIDSNEDLRRGITLLARPNQEIKNSISSFQQELKKIEPNQYYQPSDDLHLTVLSIISCYAGFQLTQINSEDYERVVSECLSKPMEIKFEGITASPSGILVQGFPEGDGLKKLRNELRKRFKSSQFQHSIDSRYKINTAHLTVMRFRKRIADFGEFVRLLDEFRNFSFGRMKVDQLDLVFNDWYQRTDVVKKLATFELG
ncbi:2'-5' RNA ligase family protein [Reichenbachiella sp.]|uniref:2'-5' RNA ligase family protein n=1 Tax=Reichenbachiella sp. TaxID=2184521 RepID=UPI003BB052F7